MSEPGTPEDARFFAEVTPQMLKNPQRLKNLQDLLRSLEKNGGPETISGEVEGPFNLRTEYRVTAKIVDAKDLFKSRGYHPRPRRR
jgi:hypothetical protein